MKVIVKRFCLSHDGRIYRAGEVADIADEKLARRLVAQSDGTMDFFASSPAPADDELDADQEPRGEDVGEDEETSELSDAVEIPAADPAAAVTSGKRSGKRR